MAQFDVHRVDGTFVVDCQTDALCQLTTRAVAPLLRSSEVPKPIMRLHPVFQLEGDAFLLATHLLTAVPTRDLGPPVLSLASQRYSIKNALDMLLSGT